MLNGNLLLINGGIVFMNNIIKKIKFVLALLLSVLFNCSSDKTINELPYESFGIYLNQDESLILSDRDIEAYIKSDHKIVLNKQGITKWNSYIKYDSIQTPPIPILSEKLYQKEFSVKLDSDIIYTGKFWSSASSLGYNGIVIFDVLFVCDSLHNWISIQNGYAANPLHDLRNNDKIFDFFGSKGKLK